MVVATKMAKVFPFGPTRLGLRRSREPQHGQGAGDKYKNMKVGQQRGDCSPR